MTRLTEKQYRAWIWVLMSVYVVLMLVVFPYARHAGSSDVRAALAIVCVSPVVATIWFMLRRVMGSDELQQRLHLIALSCATAIVAAASLIVGFLQTVRVLVLDGDILIWVFPSLCLVYGVSRILFSRRYGGSGCEG